MWRTGESTANPKMVLELVYGADFNIFIYLFTFTSLLALIMWSIAISARAAFFGLHLVLRLRGASTNLCEDLDSIVDS